MSRKADADIRPAIRLGDKILEVTDPRSVQTVVADLITECRVFDNMIQLALGTVVAHPHPDGAITPVVEVCSRIRLPISVAIDIHRIVENSLKPPVPKAGQH
jgi:hypothetical protein